MYSSTFPSGPVTDAYLLRERITAAGETGRDMVNRIVGALSAVDASFDPRGAAAFADRLGRALDSSLIVFSTPIMTNAGRYPDRPLADCAVPPVDLRGDLSAATALVDGYHRAGMGTGFLLDELDDPVAVLRRLNDAALAGAASGAEDRPVGNMAILSLSHPAALEFVGCKIGADDRGERWRFNISLRVTDAEMRSAVGSAGRERELLTAAAHAAHACADPGLVFADRMDEANPTPQVGPYRSTAPCAEVGLVAGETCQFGYVNLGRFHRRVGEVPLNLPALADTVATLVRALDDAVEAGLAHYPDPVSSRVMSSKRKIGVGVCGLADLLLASGLPYDSADGRRLATDALTFVNHVSKLASVELAARRGPCPAVGGGRSRYADPAFLARFAAPGSRTVTAAQWTALAEQVAGDGMLRNCSTTAIPPTGRSAPVVGASAGIEPLFQLTDPDLSGRIHPAVRSIVEEAGRADLIAPVSARFRLPEVAGIPPRLAAVLATATQISPNEHLAMVAAVQACVDEAVSKTVNLPSTATATTVLDTYAAAWAAGCKGIPVYVDGSRRVQPKAL